MSGSMRVLKIAAVATFAAISLQAVATAKVPHGSASDSQGGAVSPKPFGTSFAGLKYKKGAFSGKVRSMFSASDIPDDSGEVVAKGNTCKAGRKVKVYRTAKGKDPLVKAGKTNKRGVFKIKGAKQKGKKYYVSVAKKEFLWWQYLDASTGTTSMNYGLCKKAKAGF